MVVIHKGSINNKLSKSFNFGSEQMTLDLIENYLKKKEQYKAIWDMITMNQ